jgi:hypothetical protein
MEIKAGKYSLAKVHNSLKIDAKGNFVLDDLKELKPEFIDGF